MTSARAATWWWRETTPQDGGDWVRLFNEAFGKDKDDRTFRWKYLDNPHGPPVARVACDERGGVVGAYAYLPRRFLSDGQPVTLMQASDAMVVPAFRRQGIFTGLDDVVCEAAGQGGCPWAFAYSGRLSFNGFLGNGWKHIGDAPLWRLPFRSRRGLQRLGRASAVAVLAAPLVDVVMGWRHRARLADVAETTLERLDRFDESADELFSAAAPAAGLVGVRDHGWLNWRYVDNPTRRQECFALRREGRLDGYLVAEWGAGQAWLVDHVARDAGARRLLLEAYTAASWRRGCEEATALLFEHHPSVAELRALGYRFGRRRKAFRDVFPFIVRACRDDASGDDLHMTRWHLADGDRDAEHMSPST